VDNKQEESFSDLAQAAGLEAALPELESNEPAEYHIKDEFEDDLNAGESKEEAEEEVKPKAPWVDFKLINLTDDLKNLFKKPILIAIVALGLLIFGLFVALLIQYRQEEYAKELDGYVKINHKAPKWHKGELPKYLQEYLHELEIKKHKELEDMLVIKPDPREDKATLEGKYPDGLTNDDVIKILKSQKIGPVNGFGAEKPELINLSGLDLTKLNYRYLNNFVSSDLRYANFSGILLEEVNFRGASLQHAQFVETQFKACNFVRARLAYANFFAAVADGSNFAGAVADKAHFYRASLVDANFNNSVFKESDFSETLMDGILADHGFFEGSDFSSSSLIGASFRGANLVGVSFVNCDLRNADFSQANLAGANFTGADIAGAKFKDADVSMTNFENIVNATYEQLYETKFFLSAKNVPKTLVPTKRSWKERYVAPHDPNKK